MRPVLIAVVLLCCVGCGYRFGQGPLPCTYRTICVPYVEGDYRGLLTAALVRQIATTGGLRYVTGGADLLLKVCLLEPQEENIGFISAAANDGSGSKVVLPNEARLSVLAKTTVIDRCTGACVLGPLEIPYSIVFDFESDLGRVDVEQLGLGQLQMYNLAKEEATVPLYTLLAQKIVDYVNHGW